MMTLTLLDKAILSFINRCHSKHAFVNLHM